MARSVAIAAVACVALGLMAGPAGASLSTSPIQLPTGAPLSGPASPYPATLDISGYNGTITDVDAQLLGVEHTWPDDLDVLLVSPSGTAVMLLSDAGAGIDLTGQGPEFDDAAASFAPDEAALDYGPYKPTNYDGPDSMPAPAPPGSHSATLAAFNGENPNGRWSLYVVDDAGNDTGQITNGFRVSIRTTEGFAIADPGPAADYPASVEVTGRAKPITNLQVRLNGFAHGWPDDVDVLLVGPGGQSSLIMSDTGGGNSQKYESPNFTFSDAAPTGMEDESPALLGLYRPTDFEPGDVFSAPAPPGPYGASLSVFNGTDPNGTWRLFVQDDGNPGYGGSIEGGFTLLIETPTPTRPPGPPGGDGTAPTPSGLRLGPHSFRAAARGASASGRGRAPVGTEVTFISDEAARARFTVQRSRPGVRKRGRCVRPKRGARGRRCTRWVTLRGSFGWDAVAGANSLRFSGRLRGRRLAPGRYRLALRLTDAAGNRSVPVRTGFRIVR